MHAQKILLPTDFSDNSDAALEKATALARDTGATLIIVHVREPHPPYIDTGFAGHVESGPSPDHLLARTKPADPDVSYAQKMLTGDPAAEVVQFAEEEGVDMIVMGTHGRTGITRLLMGSVAEAVVRQAACPVLTVKQPAVEKADTN